MKKLLTTLSLLITVFSVNLDCKAAIITAVTNGGAWASTTSWNLGRAPVCGDTIIVPSGINLRISANVNLDDGNLICSAVRVSVAGSLSFASGKKLRLAEGACFRVESGGVVRESVVGAGSSESIDIDGDELWESVDGPLNGPAFLGCDVVLPVNLISFEVNQDSESFSLEWKVAQEKDLAYYEVFISEDGIDWESIVTQVAQGTSSTEQKYQYKYIRENLSNDNLYFKLQAIDLNGKKNTLAYKNIKLDLNLSLKKNELNVFPNPSSQNSILNIAFISSQEDLVEVEILDFSGKIIFVKKINSQKGNNLVLLENKELIKGNYVLRLTTSDFSSNKKIIIL